MVFQSFVCRHQESVITKGILSEDPRPEFAGCAKRLLRLYLVEVIGLLLRCRQRHQPGFLPVLPSSHSL